MIFYLFPFPCKEKHFQLSDHSLIFISRRYHFLVKSEYIAAISTTYSPLARLLEEAYILAAFQEKIHGC